MSAFLSVSFIFHSSRWVGLLVNIHNQEQTYGQIRNRHSPAPRNSHWTVKWFNVTSVGYLEPLYDLQLVRVLDAVEHELHVCCERSHAVEWRYKGDGDGPVGIHLAAKEEIAREVVRAEVVFAAHDHKICYSIGANKEEIS